MQRVRERIKAITAPRHRLPEPIEPIVAEVNRVVRGWGAYFRVGNAARKFHAVDAYVSMRLERFLVKKTRRSWRGRLRDIWALLDKLGVYRLSGTVAWATVRTSALSIPIPNALVATITRAWPDMNRSWVRARTSRSRPAW